MRKDGQRSLSFGLIGRRRINLPSSYPWHRRLVMMRDKGIIALAWPKDMGKGLGTERGTGLVVAKDCLESGVEAL